jgi:hypothetical protein
MPPLVRLRFRVDPDRSFRRWLKHGESVLRHWTANGVGEAGLEALERHHAAIYASGGATGLGGIASGMGPWAALRARTLKARALRRRLSRIAPYDYQGNPVAEGLILVWSGRLRDSLTTKGNLYGDAIRRIGPRGITYGTRAPTAEKHLVGEGGIPIRPPLDVDVGPGVAMSAMAERLWLLLNSNPGSAPPSPGMIPSAAGFYVRQ